MADEVKEKLAKKERKIYKGNAVKVKDLADSGFKAGLPIQPMDRKFTVQGIRGELPPSFLVTKFTAGYQAGTKTMHFIAPSENYRRQVVVPETLELNVLAGARGQELLDIWNSKLEKSFSPMAYRLGCTSGADPEIFVLDAKGKVIPAWTFLGSKEKPTKFESGDGYKESAYWDGFQAEFTTPAGVTCLVRMCDTVRSGLKAIYQAMPKKGKLSIKSVVEVDPKVLGEAKEEHVAFGCAPSKNAYGLRGNTQSGRVVPYRFAGGHIHMGINEESKKNIPKIVKALDTVLGVGCVSLFAGLDNPIRRQFYGQAGEYRTPPHGLEYRVLSNAWLCHPVIFHLVFDTARAVAGLVEDGFELSDFWQSNQQSTLDTIMNSDVDQARKILRGNEKVFQRILGMATGHTELAYRVFYNGLGDLVKNPGDIAGNWKLESDSAWTHHANVRTFSGAAVTSNKV